MENKKLLIGAGVVIVGYLLWKKSQSQSVAKNDVIIPQSSMTQQEKTSLFEKAINSWKGGVAPPREWEENNRKSVDLAKAKIKELKLDAEFSAWLSNRPKDTGALPN
jgi:hypothetical protein